MVRSTHDIDTATKMSDTFLHADQSPGVLRASRPNADSFSIVGYFYQDIMAMARRSYPYRRGLRMPLYIGHLFLHDPKKSDAALRVQVGFGSALIDLQGEIESSQSRGALDVPFDCSPDP